MSSRVSSTGFGSLYATSRGASSTTTGGAIPTLATWIRRTHAAVALARAIARRMKVPTPITVPVGQSAWPDNPVVDCHSEWLYRPTVAVTEETGKKSSSERTSYRAGVNRPGLVRLTRPGTVPGTSSSHTGGRAGVESCSVRSPGRWLSTAPAADAPWHRAGCPRSGSDTWSGR